MSVIVEAASDNSQQLPIDPLKWRESDDGNTDYHRANAWGYTLWVLDCDGDRLDWYVAHKKSKEIVASGGYPGDPMDDWELQFDVGRKLATMAAWEAAKRGDRGLNATRHD